MDYYSLLNLRREPFSNSPDPKYFFKSQQHFACLQKLELALRLRRGLNVVVGEVGTGKTTLCRQLIRRFADDEQMETHLILDPAFDSAYDFLHNVAVMITDTPPPPAADLWQLKEMIKKSLYHKGVDQDRTVVLIIDEGQKLPRFCIELLREFLNYETNAYKLLQIAIFAQKEFDAVLAQQANFSDRINLLHYLEPMGFKDTREMIQFRIRQSSRSSKPLSLFTLPAYWSIYRSTRGYPRKIINLCHQSILAMIIQNRTKAGAGLVRSCVKRAVSSAAGPGNRWLRLLTGLAVVLVIVAAGLWMRPQKRDPLSNDWQNPLIARGSPPTLTVFTIEGSPASLSPVSSIGLASGAGSRHGDVQPPHGPERLFDPVDAATPSKGAFSDGDPMPEPNAPLRVSKAAPGHAMAPAPPGILGALTIRDGDTLMNMIRKVRGTYGSDYLNALIAINPHLDDPDNLRIGARLLFPAIAVHLEPASQSKWRLKLFETDRFEEALDVAAQSGRQAHHRRVLPYWTEQNGLRFLILADPPYEREGEARSRITELANPSAADVIQLSQLGNNPVFYANLY